MTAPRFGGFQLIDSTFPDYRPEPPEPEEQIAAALRYAQGLYGGPLTGSTGLRFALEMLDDEICRLRHLRELYEQRIDALEDP